MPLESELNDLTFRTEGVESIDGSMEGHEIRLRYLPGLYSAGREEVMPNFSGEELWIEGSEKGCRSL